MSERNDVLRKMTALLNDTNDFLTAPIPPGFAPPEAPIPPMVTVASAFPVNSGLPNLDNVAAEVANTLSHMPAQAPVAPAMTTLPGSESIVYEVRVKNADGVKRFAVFNKTLNTVIKADLEVREAAEAIVKYLQRGFSFDSAKVQEIIDLEETFFRNKNDANLFKKRYETSIEKEEFKSAEVFETRFQVAKANAIVAADQLRSILASFR